LCFPPFLFGVDTAYFAFYYGDADSRVSIGCEPVRHLLEDKNMEIVKSKNLSEIAGKFSKAMLDDPLHVYFFPDAKTRGRKIYAMYYFMVKMNMLNTYGTSDCCEGVAVWEKPYDHLLKVKLKDFIIGLGLLCRVGFPAINRMLKYQRWSSRLKKKTIGDPFWYLNVIIVDPAFQGKGFASQLIRPVLASADESGHKVCLETQNVHNIPMYEKYGFQVASSQTIPGTKITHYILIRA
jgi:ribosomal protein S18 acetylase RimI-like enzyme